MFAFILMDKMRLLNHVAKNNSLPLKTLQFVGKNVIRHLTYIWYKIKIKLEVKIRKRQELS